MKRLSLFLALALVSVGLTRAEIKLAALFGNNAVLQQDASLPVWGTAAPGEEITVTFSSQKKTTVTGTDGNWSVQLDPEKASLVGHDLIVTSTQSPPVKITELLVGEVWICSGQSNMERQLGLRGGQKPLENWEQEAASANYPLLRHFAVDRKPSDTPLPETKGSWEVCTPLTAPNFTAVGYYFGRDLSKKLNVPVGLIHTSWGGTPAEAWTRREALEEALPTTLERQQKEVAGYAAALEKYQAEEPKLLADWEKASAEAKAANKPAPRKPGPPRDPTTSQNRPSCLYNGMVHPLLPFAIRGVIWYQGESNASRAKEYQTLFPLMIMDWRKQWKQGDFPFLFVQIAPYKGQNPEIREAQLLTWKKTPNTSMVVTADVGDAEDIHPTRKEPVGQRLGLAARALVYGEKIEYSGPVYEAVEFKEGKAIITFSHVGGGLVAKDGELKGFNLAGTDKVFQPGNAEIKGNTVVVSSAQVTQPVAVRYGWTNVPIVNLFNLDGLPASPFRSDVE